MKLASLAAAQAFCAHGSAHPEPEWLDLEAAAGCAARDDVPFCRGTRGGS